MTGVPPAEVRTGRAAGAGAGASADTSTGTSTGAAPCAGTAANAPAQPPDPDGTSADGAPRLGRFLARAAVVTAVLTAAGSLFGLLRDQAIARLFGADAGTDAFLVAWTVPELAATLLIEDAMALILVPAFSLALSRRAAREQARGKPGAPEADGAGPRDPVRALVRYTLPRLVLLLAAVTGALMPAAPLVVRALAPGLPNPGTAVDCLRLTALTVLGFGLAGYFSAALRAHRRFVAPAAIYVAYNTAIVAVMFAGHRLWGVRAAALGVAAGGVLMVLVQLPSFVGRLRQRTDEGAGGRGGAQPQLSRHRTACRRDPHQQPPRDLRPRSAGRARLVGLGVLAPVTVFAVTRQAQVLFERFLASSLPSGAISHLNYAQKVAQMPMVLSLMVCTVTFPVVARAMADGEPERARRRVERDLALAAIVVLLGAAYVLACAPQIVQLLFQRGAFDARDTAGTASVMRVYSFGLLGHSLVGALIRPFFSGARPTWYPALAMGAGLAVTMAAGAFAAGPWGADGIAAANAAGITVTALLLLRGLGARVVAIDVRAVAAGLSRLLLAAGAAAVAGWCAAGAAGGPWSGAAAGAAAVLAVFTAAGLLLRAPEVPQLFATVTRRVAHAR